MSRIPGAVEAFGGNFTALQHSTVFLEGGWGAPMLKSVIRYSLHKELPSGLYSVIIGHDSAEGTPPCYAVPMPHQEG